MSEKKMEQLLPTAAQPLAEKSGYFLKLHSVWDRIRSSGNGTERSFVSALTFCFDVEKVYKHSVSDICETHTFGVLSCTNMGFVMARSHVSTFCVQDLRLPGARSNLIRATSEAQFIDRFGRKPISYGQSDMWCTIAEWYVLLGFGRPPRMPLAFCQFAEENNLPLPPEV